MVEGGRHKNDQNNGSNRNSNNWDIGGIVGRKLGYGIVRVDFGGGLIPANIPSRTARIKRGGGVKYDSNRKKTSNSKKTD